MNNNQNLLKPKVESRVSQALREYSRAQLHLNNPKTNSTTESKYVYILPKPPSQNYQKTQEQNKKIISKYHSRQNNSSIPIDQTRKTHYKQSTEKIPEHRSMNKNHSFFESKKEKSENKKYTPRTTYTYKQPESKNLKDNNRERKTQEKNNINTNNNNNNNNNKKYETISYEHQGRRKRQYENKSYQQEKLPPKYYRNNPNIFNINTLKMKGTLVAQKICNIIIKGGSSKIKKESINISNNTQRLNNGREIEYEVEDNVNYNYNNEEEIEEDSLNDNNEKKLRKFKKKNKIKKKTKKKNYNPIIEMQKAQSF